MKRVGNVAKAPGEQGRAQDAKPDPPKVVKVQKATSLRASVFMVLLALQFGFQPMLTKAFLKSSTSRTGTVVACELVKLVVACLVACFSGSNNPFHAPGWTVKDSVKVAGLPALVYSVQNICLQIAYQHVDPIMFNLLNQTKLLSTAFFIYVMLGIKQSPMQLLALALLLTGACLLTVGGDSDAIYRLFSRPGIVDTAMAEQDALYMLGVGMLLFASASSGLAGALCQYAMQDKGRNALLMSTEMTMFSLLFLGISLLGSSDGVRMREEGLFNNFTLYSMIPVSTNALGGLFVGEITKHGGAIQKGIAIIMALFVTTALDVVFQGAAMTWNVWVSLLLIILSIWMHSNYPAPRVQKTKPKKA